MTQAPSTNQRFSSDRSLLRRLRKGESDAATDLYYRYANRIRALAGAQIGDRLARRVEPEDVVQSVFRTFFRRVVDGHYDVPDGDEIWGLFLVIALNKVRAMGVRHAAAKRDIARERPLSDDHSDIPAPDSDDTVLAEVVAQILEALPDMHQQVVSMRIDGHSTDEISQAVSRSRRTVERVLQEFRTRLSAQIDKDT